MNKKNTLGNPYASGLAATREHYHAVRSINTHGAIAHMGALAQEIMRAGHTDDELKALDMARGQVQHVAQVINGERLHQQARRQLDKEAMVECKMSHRNKVFLGISA